MFRILSFLHKPSVFVLPKRGFKKREFQLKKMPDDYPQVKGSEVWRRKFRTRFRNLDSDGDGFVTANDYVMGALLVAERIGLGAKRTNALLESRLHVWKNISTNGTGVDTVTEEEFINNVLASVNSSIRHYIPTHGSREFDTIDQDGVGFVSLKDHEQFFYGNAIPVHFSPEIFKVLDANGDGRLSREEFVQGWVDFLLGEDPESPYHCFLGPLVD